MKVTGPGSGNAPPPVDDVAEGKAVTGSEFGAKVDKLGSPDQGAAAVAPATPGLVSDIGAELRAGRLTPQAALERVIERVVDRQVGPGAPAAVKDKVGAALRQALEDDPTLADKVRALAR